jgi:hypothetical protein
MRSIILLIFIALMMTAKCERAESAYFAEGVFDDPNLIHPPEDDVKPVPEEEVVLPIIPPGPQPEPAPEPVVPDVTPKPPVEPVIVPDLRAGELFVVATPKKFLVWDRPKGIVSVKRLVGPREFYAKFADAVDRNIEQERHYSQPFIYVIRAEKRGTVELIMSPIDADDEAQAIQHTLIVMGRGPQPPPEPEPDVDPVDPPTPGPITSFRVIFVKESGQTLNPGQTAIPGAKVIRDYLTAKTTPEGNLAGWREYDPQQITANEQPTMKALWEKVKPNLIPAPCVVIEVNGRFTVLPFPADVNAMMMKLKEYGGN